MSTGPRFPLERIEPFASGLVKLLEPSCERITVAGSIRRQRPDVGDVELVAVPRFEDAPEGLWGDASRTNVLSRQIAQLTDEGLFEVLSGGERYIKARHLGLGIQVDLFMVLPPASWGLILLIRTGPAEYSHGLAIEARRRGMHFCEGALHGSLGIPGRTDCTCPVIPTPTEESVYAALGLPFLAPRDRVER
jgi:DNA polymerase/3'-5' exonuclease PolX